MCARREIDALRRVDPTPESPVMSRIELKYGRHSSIPFDYAKDRFDILGSQSIRAPLSDVQIGERLDEPIGSPVLDDIVQPGDTVLLVVPDATRQTGSGQVVNLLVRRLIAAGTAPFDIRII